MTQTNESVWPLEWLTKASPSTIRFECQGSRHEFCPSRSNHRLNIQHPLYCTVCCIFPLMPVAYVERYNRQYFGFIISITTPDALGFQRPKQVHQRHRQLHLGGYRNPLIWAHHNHFKRKACFIPQLQRGCEVLVE